MGKDSSMTRYHIWTLGCQMNVADSQKLAAGLERLGWRPTDRPEEADLVVINTCSVRQHAEERAFGKLGVLRAAKRERPQMRIAVMGCLVGPKTQHLRRRFPFVDVFARPQEYEPILEAVGYGRADLGGEFWPHTFARPGAPTAYVPVVHGCDKFCTYCIVPYRRGRERSRPIAEVVEEVEHLTAGGVREVTLLGQTVEAYGHGLPPEAGRPGPPDLGDLMRAIHDIPGLRRIRFLTSYPPDMTERIIDAVAGLPKVCESFSLPVQSGDDAVLARMRRGYTVDEYLEKIDLVRRRVPGTAVSTDVIVGFCGETDDEFRRTYDLLARLRFDKVHVAAYSPRPGTIAWRRLEDDVPPAVKSERLHAVEELEASIAGEINAALLGQTVEVLVEERRGGRPMGRTRTARLVHFDAPPAGGRQSAGPGDLVQVLVTQASPWSLQGRLRGTEPGRPGEDGLLHLTPVDAASAAAR